MKVAEILAPERVAIGAELASKKAVLEKLSEMLASADPSLQPKTVFESLLARERLGTTGLGAGIAIPHGRVATGDVAIGAFLRTGTPIGFDAVDNEPVDLFFALCVPEEATSEHLELLSELAAAFSDQEFVKDLRASSGEADVFRMLTRERERSD